MELTLTRQSDKESRVTVLLGRQSSHTFDLRSLIPDDEKGPPQPLADPAGYGKVLYHALFPPGAPARQALEQERKQRPGPGRLLIVTIDNDLDAIPWEYTCDDAGDFLALECHFVRGLSPDLRIDLPVLTQGLSIVAVPSNPLSCDLDALNIEGEWVRLKEVIGELTYAVTLERARPPTLERLRQLIANQQQRIIHFMGHGGQHEKAGAFLCFEKEHGELDPVSAKDFMRRVRGSAFLVTLNACVTATPGETDLHNLASALARQQVPYALGMRFSIPDQDALSFSRTFYSELARGSSVEEALFQARLTLARSPRAWAIGVPVLYTSLSAPAPGFSPVPGTPIINERQPPMEVTALPRAEGAFQGRIEELLILGEALTGESRPRILTIHGGGGQGKTALAREAVERFAWAWPGGVYAATLETLPARDVFVVDLAGFLRLIDVRDEVSLDPSTLEKLVFAQLAERRLLIVLDNVETLIDAVDEQNRSAMQLAGFIRQLPGPMVTLLVASRVQLSWPGEICLELGGLAPEEGALLFRQNAPQRADVIDLHLAQGLSRNVAGHPFSLRLLGGAFNSVTLSLSSFLEDWDEQLFTAENTYVGEEHRQRTIYACIEYSIRYLDTPLRTLLSKLWVFHARFLPETAAALFKSGSVTERTDSRHSVIHDQLAALWRRGLLNKEVTILLEGQIEFYHLLPIMRPFVERYLADEKEREPLLARFGEVHAQLAHGLSQGVDRSSQALFIAGRCFEDLERGYSFVTEVERGYYLLFWGNVLHRLGDRRRGLRFIEQALEVGQGRDKILEMRALNVMSYVYLNMGKLEEAIELCEQTVTMLRLIGDRAGEAAFLHNMATAYQRVEKTQEALRLFHQALLIRREVGDRVGEAATLGNIAGVYLDSGKLEEALEFYKQALPLMRGVGDRVGEASILYNVACHAQTMQNYEEARMAFEASIALEQQLAHSEGEAAGLVGLALLLYRYLDSPQEAIMNMQQALDVMTAADLPQDASGRTREIVQQFLEVMRKDIPFDQTASTSTKISSVDLQRMVIDAIAIMTTVRERQPAWREAVTKALHMAQHESDLQNEADLFSGLLDILDGKSPILPPGHPYAQAITTIQQGIALNQTKAHLPFDIEFIPRSIEALLGGQQEKIQCTQYLAAQAFKTEGEELKALINTIQLALFGSPLIQLGQI